MDAIPSVNMAKCFPRMSGLPPSMANLVEAVKDLVCVRIHYSLTYRCLWMCMEGKVNPMRCLSCKGYANHKI